MPASEENAALSTLNRSDDSESTAITRLFLQFSDSRIASALGNIQKCVALLSDDQLWYRGGEYENSVGNLLLHLAGNIRQFILHAVAGEPDVRQRDDEFSLTVRLSRADLLDTFESTITQARAVILRLQPADLLTPTDPHNVGWKIITKLEAVYQAVGHLQLHTGQIVILTKQFTESDLDLSIPRKR